MPSDVQYLPLSALVELRTEKIARGKDPNLPYIGLEHIAQGEPLLLGTLPSINSISTNCVFETGDILFGKLRPNLRKSLQIGFRGYCSTDILVLRARQGAHPGFAAKIFQSDMVFEAAVQTAIGTKMPRTSWEYLKALHVFVPPLPEQRRISEILDAADEAIQQMERLIAKLKAIKAGLLHDLLTRGLDEHGHLRDPQTHLQFKDSPLGMMPEEWAIWQLQDLSSVTVGYVGPTGKHYCSPDEGVLFLRTGNITERGIDLSEVRYVPRAFHERTLKSALHPGDVVVSRVGYTGIAAVIPSGLGDVNCANMIVIRPSDCLLPEFLSFLFASDVSAAQIRGFTAGSAQPVFNIRLVERLLVPVPHRTEQRQIASALNIDNARIRAEETALEKLRQVKRGLMDDLLTGRVRVNPKQEAHG